MNSFYSNVERLAKSVAIRQGALSNSPMQERADGTIVLCAAACIAYAGHILKFGEEAAESMIQKVRDNALSLESAFSNIGLSENICRAIRIDNDSTSIEKRLDWFSKKNIFHAEN